MAKKDEALPVWFGKKRLISLFYYNEFDGYIEPGMQILGCSKSTIKRKMREGTFDHEETIALARALKMTPRDYCECFLKGLFEEIEE